MFGLVYRVDDLTDGSFYIGKCESKKSWDGGYTGSGRYWNSHKHKHPDHLYKRTVLKDNFGSKKEIYEYELQEIKKVIKNKNCYNLKDTIQGSYIPPEPCPLCGSKHSHKKNCPNLDTKNICSECGGIYGRHFKFCSEYKPLEPCKECGAKVGHKKSCSKYVENICPECKASHGQHKKGCSHYKDPTPCPECGVIRGHLKTCSYYEKPEPCSECGAFYGKHKDFCSKSKGECEYCGYSLKSNRHAKSCPLYKKIKVSEKVCPECGGKDGKHLKSCSKYVLPSPCPECGSIFGHKDSCSKSKGRCEYCGYSLKSHHHDKNCPLYKEPKKSKPCKYCGSTTCHKKGCPLAKKSEVCKECGGKRGHHFKNCSLYNKS